jgi:hypothetical protein
MPAIAGRGKRRRHITDNDAVFANPTFGDATEQLLSLCEALEPPEIIVKCLAILYEKPVKLLCWVGDAEPTGGTPRVTPGLYASDLFVKLLQAFRALDWEVVAVILEQAKSPVL